MNDSLLSESKMTGIPGDQISATGSSNSDTGLETPTNDGTGLETPRDTGPPDAIRTPFPRNRDDFNEMIVGRQFYQFRLTQTLMDLCLTIFSTRNFRDYFTFLDNESIWEVNDVLSISDDRLKDLSTLHPIRHEIDQLRILRAWGVFLLQSEGTRNIDWTD